MKTSYIISIFSVILLLIRCTQNEIEKSAIEEFKFPKLEGDFGNGNTINTLEQLGSKTYSLQNNRSAKTHININENNRSVAKTPLPYSTTNSINLYIDNSQEFTIKYQDSYLPPPPNINEYGIKISEYQSPYDSIKVFPAYIVNNSDSLQGIENRDGKIIMIQEALNSQNEWEPIEYFSNSGCGNSFGITTLDTNCYIMFGVNKYQGDFKTKLRVRLRTNGKTIFSNQFEGYINKKQFNGGKEDPIYYNYLKNGY